MPKRRQRGMSVKPQPGRLGKGRTRSLWRQYNLRPYFHLRSPPGRARTSWSDSRPKRCFRAQCGLKHQDHSLSSSVRRSGLSSQEFITFTRTINDEPIINVHRGGETRMRLTLTLTPKEMDVYDNRSWDSVVQVLFRVGEDIGGIVLWDKLPRQAIININKQLKLVCTSSPLELSRFMELWPRQGDLPVTFTWVDVPGVSFRVRVDYVFIRNPHLFRERLNIRPVKFFLQMLREREADDSQELVLLSEQVSLLCPLSLRRMDSPVQGANCRHLQCFDGATYLQLNLQNPRWVCPLCRDLAYPDSLILDEFTQNLLKECPADSALLTNSAQWSPR